MGVPQPEEGQVDPRYCCCCTLLITSARLGQTLHLLDQLYQNVVDGTVGVARHQDGAPGQKEGLRNHQEGRI